MPRADILPLLPYLGWSVERVAQQLTDVEEIVAPAEHASECHALVDCLNQARQGAGLPSVSLTLTAAHAAQGPPAVQQQQQGDVSQASGPHCSDTQQQQQQQQQCTESTAQGGETGSQVIGDWASPILQFEKVAVGGTFDRLHAGHRLLLAATAIVAKERIFVGITGGLHRVGSHRLCDRSVPFPYACSLEPLLAADQLLASKANRELLQSYEEREAAAVRYMRLVNPRASVVAGPLTDPKVRAKAAAWPAGGELKGLLTIWTAALRMVWAAQRPSTAPRFAGTALTGTQVLQEPPLCAVDPEFDAIVVSQETLPGAIAINQVQDGWGSGAACKPNTVSTGSFLGSPFML